MENPKNTSLDPLKYKKRPGTTDRGRDYEDYVTADFILKLLPDDNVRDFKFSSNDKDYGAFDDIIMEIEDTDGTEHKYAIQLKHRDQTELKVTQLTTQSEKSSDFSISKYSKSFLQNREIFSNFKLILWTNSKFKSDKNNILTLYDKDDETEFKVKIVECQPLLRLQTSYGNYYKFEILSNESLSVQKLKQYVEFFECFFLYTNQPNVDNFKKNEIPRNAAVLTSDRSFVDKYLKFISEWSLRKGLKEKLTKSMMCKVVALYLSDDAIHPHHFEETTEGARLLQKVIPYFDVTVFRDKSLNNVRRIWSDYKSILRGKDLEKLNGIRKKYQISTKYIEDIDELTDELCTKLLWVMDECPLIVRNAPNTLEAIKICRQREKFVCICEDPNCDVEHKSIFRKLSDLKRHGSLYKELVRELKFPLLGEEMTLHKLIRLDKHFEDIITTDTLLSLISHSDLLEQKKEKIPLYIERYLYKTMIRLEDVHRIDEKTLILISNIDKHKAESLFRNFEIIHIYDQNKENIKSPKIYVDASNTSQEEFAELCRRNNNYKNYHHFKFCSKELEWIRSVSGVSDLQEFCVQHEELVETEIIENMHNKINIIVGGAGMGKTFFLKRLKNSLICKNLVILVTPNDVHKLCEELKNFTEFYDFMFKADDFKKLLARNGRLVVLWDAVDEVSEEERITVENLILYLSENGTVNFVTSRSHLKSKLEHKFGVFAKELRPFDDKQQTDYISRSVENVREDVKESIKRLPEIFGTPLYIFLLTEIYREDPDKYRKVFTENLCTTDLYNFFIDQQFDLYFKEKCNMVPNDLNKDLLDDYKTYRMEKYQAIAIKLLFQEEFISKLNLQNCDQFLTKISKERDAIGFIINVREEEKQTEFIHVSYAEYFAALYLFHNCRKIKHLGDVIFDKEYTNIRLFFDMFSAQNSLLHIAVLNKNLGFLEKNQDILNSKDSQERSLLQIAVSWTERYPLLQVTECNGHYSINDRTDYVTNPQSETDQEIIKLLLKKCDLTYKDPLFNCTVTMYAEKCECLVTAAFIEKNLKSDYLKTKDLSFLCSLLYYSAKYGITEILDMFDDVTFIHNRSNNSLLHIAVENNRSEYVSKLLSHQTYKHKIDFVNIYKETSLHVAAKNGNADVVKFLVENGADVNKPSKRDETPLFRAAISGSLEVALLLVENGADVNKASADSETPLFRAARNANVEVVKLLVKNGANVNKEGDDNETPLFRAARSGSLEIVKFLVENGADVDKTSKRNETPLFRAAISGSLDAVRFLVESGAEVNKVSADNQTPLFRAAVSDSLEVVKFLVENGADVNKASADNETALFRAARGGNLEVVKFLVENGTDVNKASDDNETPLFRAARSDTLEVVKLLIENGADVNKPSKRNETPLFRAAGSDNLEIVKFLVENGADVNKTSDDNESPLFRAAINDNLDVVKFLVENGADVNKANDANETPLFRAAISDNLEIVKFLVENGADINKTSDGNETPLFWAARSDNLEVIQFLIEKGSDVNKTSHTNETPLFWATRNGNLEVIKLLVENGADVNKTSKRNETTLFRAALSDNLEVVKLLVENGADVNTAIVINETPLFWMSRSLNLEVVKFLVENGADVNKTSKGNETLLFWSARSNNLEVVKFLVRNGADVNKTSDGNETPLLLAARSGSLEVVTFLVEKGADVNQSDIHVAVENGNKEIVKFLEEKINPATNKLEKTSAKKKDVTS